MLWNPLEHATGVWLHVSRETWLVVVNAHRGRLFWVPRLFGHDERAVALSLRELRTRLGPFFNEISAAIIADVQSYGQPTGLVPRGLGIYLHLRRRQVKRLVVIILRFNFHRIVLSPNLQAALLVEALEFCDRICTLLAQQR